MSTVLLRKPDTLALVVALVGSIAVVGAFMTDLFLSRQSHIVAGQQRLPHFSRMLAEHTARSLEPLDLLLRDIAVDLSNNHREWRNWTPMQGWEYMIQHHSRSLPMLRALVLFDQNGNLRFISTHFPPPHINVSDRPYFQALTNGAEFTVYGPYVERDSFRYTYSMNRRLQGEQNTFAGIVFAAIEPAYFPSFCWASRLSDDSEAVIINSKGQIVASCRPSDLSRQDSTVGTQAEETLFGGRLKNGLPTIGLAAANGIQVSISPVPEYPDLRVLVAIPEDTLLLAWKQRAIEVTLFSGLIVAVLLAGGWLVRRKVRELGLVTAALDEHRQHLAERVESATAELARQKEDAERANTAKSRFLAAASHDLRQPLHALSLFAADLQHQVRTNNARHLPRLSEQIAASTGVLGELLDSLLDISRLDVSGVKTNLRPFALRTVFDRLANSYRWSAENKNISLRFRPCNAIVMSDMALVERLLANLISNAIHYTPAGGRVLVGGRRRGDTFRVEVRDNGIGIAPEHQVAIFGEFYQIGNTAREQHKGLGLGLSIVERLAKALDIPVSLRSQLQAGTTFAVTLPLASPLPSAPSSLPPLLGSPGQVFFVGGAPILTEAARMARTWGFGTTEFARARDFRIHNDKAPSIVVTEAGVAVALGAQLPATCSLVVIDGDTAAPTGATYTLSLPLRPAKLRALLEQLQKDSSKSIP